MLDGQVGLAEGLAPSAATCVLSKQVPTSSERSRAVSTVFGGLDLGCTCLFTTVPDVTLLMQSRPN